MPYHVIFTSTENSKKNRTFIHFKNVSWNFFGVCLFVPFTLGSSIFCCFYSKTWSVAYGLRDNNVSFIRLILFTKLCQNAKWCNSILNNNILKTFELDDSVFVDWKKSSLRCYAPIKWSKTKYNPLKIFKSVCL